MKYAKYSVLNTIKYYAHPFLGAIRNIVEVTVGLSLIVFVILFILNYLW